MGGKVSRMYRGAIKRVLDLAMVVLVLPIALPIAFLIGVLLSFNLRLGFRVLLRQERYGRGKGTFTMYKFRTMLADAPMVSTRQMINERAYDRYTTKLSRFIRRTSLDELPQLVNVLKGEMSLVGPRPVILKERGLVDAREGYRANDVRPGITGLAQITGQDYLMPADEKARIDGEYAANVSFFMDIACIIRTVAVVLRGGSDYKISTGSGLEIRTGAEGFGGRAELATNKP